MSWFSPRWLSRQDLLRDLVVGVILTVYLCAATTFGGIDGPWEVVRDFLVGTGVALRRVWTIPAFLLVATATFINEVVTWPYSLGVAIMLYTLAAENYPRWLCWIAATMGVVAMVLPWPEAIDPTLNVVVYLVPEAIFLAVLPVLVGFYTRARQVLLETFAQRSADEERARRLEAERIRADERNRLANEIHDVVAHRVSLMVVHTGALKLAATDERTKEIAELVRSSGRLALEELREVVGVLRSDESAPLAPTANLANLPTLLEETRSTGVDVAFHEAGTPRKLPVTVERTAYRVVQESLTNARKHAPGAPITVQLTWGSSTLDISILNETASPEAATFPESGHGLESLRERAALVSGRIEAGPIDDGGWVVRATLPYGTGGDK